MSLIQQNMGAIYDGSQRLIAPVLNSTTATQNWAVGQEFILDGNLYKVTTAIPSGSQIVVSGSSANCELADTVTEQINGVLKKVSFTKTTNNYGNIDLDLNPNHILVAVRIKTVDTNKSCYGTIFQSRSNFGWYCKVFDVTTTTPTVFVNTEIEGEYYYIDYI